MEFSVIEDEGVFKVIKDDEQIVFVSSDITEVSNFLAWKREADQKKDNCTSC
jgi:hypothetical protein